MLGKTRIEWTDRVWNPVAGCSKVSDGCQNCYAERMDRRFHPDWKEWTSPNAAHNVRLHSERLKTPLQWRYPQRVFLNSMSDLFHEQVPDEFLDEVFGVILACKILANRPDHVFQILTKRPERMLRYFTSASPAELLKRWATKMDGFVIVDDPDVLFSELVFSATCHDWDEGGRNSSGSEYMPWGYPHQLFPLSNVWLGVSIENQQSADERIPLLIQIPAAVRFLSCEPLLGPVNLDFYTHGGHLSDTAGDGIAAVRGIDWVIVGGESGPGARPAHPDWVRDLRDQCAVAKVPFFFKGWGEWAPYIDDAKFTYGAAETERNMQHFINVDGGQGVLWMTDGDGSIQNWRGDFTAGSCIINRFGKKRSGRELDGRTWDDMPIFHDDVADIPTVN